MIGQDAIARRTSDGLEWISEIGRRFADATGWPLTFHPESSDDDGGRANPDTCWSADVRNGDGVIGRMQIDLPDDPGNDRAFLSTCELAALLSSLISQLSTVRQAVEGKSNDLGLLLEMGRTAASSRVRPIRDELREYLRVAAELSGFWGAAFFLLTPDGEALKLRAVHRLEAAEIPFPLRALQTTPPDMRALTGENFTITANEGSIYARWLPADCPLGHCVRVRSPSGPAGVLWLFDRRVREITDEKAKLIQSVAAQLAGALERVVLLRESAVHHRQNHDLRVASQYQQEAETPLQMQHPAFEMAAVCSSRFELGGDLCEVIPLGEHRALVAVGDASGDSVPAAMVMSAVHGAIRAVLDDDDAPSPGRLLTLVNHSLHDLSAAFQFMSLFLGVFDFRSRELTYANAGHPFPLLARGDEVQEITTHDLLLGVLRETEYQSMTIAIRPGDVFAAYSDGFSEAADESNRLFGMEGIRNAVRAAPRNSAAEILETVQQHLDRHVGSLGIDDDQTFLVLKIE